MMEKKVELEAREDFSLCVCVRGLSINFFLSFCVNIANFAEG